MSEARKEPNASDANSGIVIIGSNPKERTFSGRIRSARTPVDGTSSGLPQARINYVVPGGIEVRSRPRRN
jgi:hypothetical protein